MTLSSSFATKPDRTCSVYSKTFLAYVYTSNLGLQLVITVAPSDGNIGNNAATDDDDDALETISLITLIYHSFCYTTEKFLCLV